VVFQLRDRVLLPDALRGIGIENSKKETAKSAKAVEGGSVETIVVGVDGSACAGEALAIAAKEAALRGARLRVVSVWEVSPAVVAGGFAPALDESALEGFREQADRVVREAIAEARRLQPEVPCEGEAVEGQPADVLVQESQDASLIVVGNRGRGGFASLLLGSVSQQVVHHAPCPVLVVRGAGP
jgi:nucleotide-binding universal stress UspA family protein